MVRLLTDWSTDDPKLAALLTNINALPERSTERLAAEAALHRGMADVLMVQLGERRAWDRDSRTARRRRAAKARTTEEDPSP